MSWTSNRPRKYRIGKVSQHAPEDLYANLSADAHGDPVLVSRLLDKEEKIELAPRRGLPTRASLIELYGTPRKARS
jgi:hypothetical protein